MFLKVKTVKGNTAYIRGEHITMVLPMCDETTRVYLINGKSIDIMADAENLTLSYIMREKFEATKVYGNGIGKYS